MIKATPAAPKSSPIPQDLNSLVPHRETPWNVSPPLFNRIKSQNSSQHFKLCEILNSDPEFNFILKYFEYHKPSGYSIKRIVCIHNPDHTQVFEGTVKNIEREANNAVFSPIGKEEEPKLERERALARWEKQVAQFSPVEIKSSSSRAPDRCFKAKVLPLWHGSSEEVCKSVCSSGFTSFGKHHHIQESAEFAKKGKNLSTDKGYFGSGIYFSNSAHYASMYSQGHLLLAWVSMREPYPVVSDVPHPNKCSDMIKLQAKEHYQNYNAHYIPVASIKPDDPKCLEYYPCYKDQPPAWDEFVVFEKSQTLPRFWIELGVDLPTVVLSTLLNAGELLTLLFSLLDKEEVKKHEALSTVLQAKVEFLLELPELTPLGPEDEKFFKLAKRVLPEGEKISHSVANVLLKSVSAAVASPSSVASLPPNQPVMSPNPQKPPATSLSGSSLSVALPPKLTLPAIAFGKEKWATHIGDAGIEPPLPPNIHEILQSPCPFWPGKKVEETHLLVLVPQTVNGKPLNLKLLGELVQKPLKGHPTKYRYFYLGAYTDPSAPKSHWALFTRDVVEKSRSKTFNEQQALIESYSQKSKVAYEVPTLLDATVCILMEYIRTGTRFYSDNPLTFTRCQEKYDADCQLAVGGGSAPGLHVFHSRGANGYNGVGGLRKF